jgi:hypothetical protein
MLIEGRYRKEKNRDWAVGGGRERMNKFIPASGFRLPPVTWGLTQGKEK